MGTKIRGGWVFVLFFFLHSFRLGVFFFFLWRELDRSTATEPFTLQEIRMQNCRAVWRCVQRAGGLVSGSSRDEELAKFGEILTQMLRKHNRLKRRRGVFAS